MKLTKRKINILFVKKKYNNEIFICFCSYLEVYFCVDFFLINCIQNFHIIFF